MNKRQAKRRAYLEAAMWLDSDLDAYDDIPDLDGEDNARMSAAMRDIADALRARGLAMKDTPDAQP